MQVEDEAARDAVRDGAALVVTRFGEARLTRSAFLSEHSPDVVATGISLWPARPSTLAAPWPGAVGLHADTVTVRGDEFVVTVTGADGLAGDAWSPVRRSRPIDEERWATVTITACRRAGRPACSSRRSRARAGCP